MSKTLFYNTVNPRLLSTLQMLMRATEFNPFRVVGGTSLSLQLGHRESVDIDLFTDFTYDAVDYKAIDQYLKLNFLYADTFATDLVGMGKSYYIGESSSKCIKLDLFYTDTFIRPELIIDGLRLESIEEIIAMKIDIISRMGRKKDFWDIHELLEYYTVEQMLEFHKERYPYSHNKKEIITNLTRFEQADNDFNPICLKGKYWEVIKLDFLDLINGLS